MIAGEVCQTINFTEGNDMVLLLNAVNAAYQIKHGRVLAQAERQALEGALNSTDDGISFFKKYKEKGKAFFDELAGKIRGQGSILTRLQAKFAGKQNVLNWINELPPNSPVLNSLDELPSDANILSNFANDLDVLKTFFEGNASGIKAWGILQEVGSDLRVNVPALTKLIDDIGVNNVLESFLRNNPSKKDVWGLIHKSFYSHDVDVLNYVDKIKSTAIVGSASSTNYTQTFFNAFPNLSLQGNGFVVHHAIEQQVIAKYPGLFSEAEIHSLQNLRGISPEINGPLHLSNIRTAWNNFYNQFPAGIIPTKQQVLDKATEIDNMYGNLFSPPIRSID